MKNEIIFLVEDAPEGGFLAKALGHDIFTEADTKEELKRMIQDAVLLHFEEGMHPQIVRLHYVQEETFGIAV